MKERIKQLIQREGLNQAQFALRVNIQSSTLSHALSGRNEVSKDIILKIHQAYPTVSINWLMFGEGEMFGNAVATATTNKENDLFSSLHQPKIEQPNTSTSISQAIENTTTLGEQEIKALPPPLYEVIPATPTTPTRRVTKIMVFYSDNTFETFSSDI